MSSNKVFLVGPGYIGWNVLDLLVKESYQVTAYTRRESHSKELEKSGAQVVLGDLNDKEKIRKLAYEHDIVFHTATADHVPSVEAILAGIKQRAGEGKSTIYIHTSGTGLLCEDKPGSSAPIYHDDKPEQVNGISDDAPHRNVDLVILKAQKELGDKAQIAIMLPPLIYGYNSAHKGRQSIQAPTLARFALKNGYAGYTGHGECVWSQIHVMDLARGYMTILESIKSGRAGNLNESPYFFCESTGENDIAWKEVAAIIGEGLYKAGKIKDPSPRSIPEQSWSDLFGEGSDRMIGQSSRSRANKLRSLDWNPVEKNFKQSFLEDELPALLEEDTGSFSGYKPVGDK